MCNIPILEKYDMNFIEKYCQKYGNVPNYTGLMHNNVITQYYHLRYLGRNIYDFVTVENIFIDKNGFLFFLRFISFEKILSNMKRNECFVFSYDKKAVSLKTFSFLGKNEHSLSEIPSDFKLTHLGSKTQ